MKRTSALFKIIFLLVIHFHTGSFAQDKSDSLSVDKWVHAIINIECQPGYFDATSQSRLPYELMLKQFKQLDTLRIKNASYGTAIYLMYKKHHFLLTARHVLNDLTSCAINIDAIYFKIIMVNDKNNPGNTRVVDSNGNMVGDLSPFLMNYRSYIFSSVNDDVGIISLDSEDSGIDFWQGLDKRGYKPISINDIDTKFKVKRNDPLMVMGYPQESWVEKTNLPLAAFYWESPMISIPIVSRGTVENIVDGDSYFNGNLFVYHGFSGGPVIIKNRLVGIVHGPKFDSLTAGNFTYATYHNQFVKSTKIIPLLEKIASRLKD